MYVSLNLSDEDRDRMVRFAQFSAGLIDIRGDEQTGAGRKPTKYGFVSIVSISVRLLTIGVLPYVFMIGGPILALCLLVSTETNEWTDAQVLSAFILWSGVGALALVGQKLIFLTSGSEICSGLVGRCLEQAGFMLGRLPTQQIMPADLAHAALETRSPTT
jgi:hypothetical protein